MCKPNEYLVVDYELDGNGEPKLIRCYSDGQLFEVMNHVRDEQQENPTRNGISVYRIGECVLDWS